MIAMLEQGVRKGRALLHEGRRPHREQPISQNVDERRENALYNLGLLRFVATSEYEEAAGYFKEALRIRKDASDTYYNLAVRLRGMEDTTAANRESRDRARVRSGLR